MALTATPPRLVPLLDQFDFACKRLTDRMAGPTVDSGDGEPVEVPRMTDDDYRWELAPNRWSVRPHATGPGPGATVLVGAGDWGRDGGRPHPWPPPITSIAWRLSHLSETLAMPRPRRSLHRDGLVGQSGQCCITEPRSPYGAISTAPGRRRQLRGAGE